MDRCPVCGGGMSHAFCATLLRKHEVSYFHCGACGFLQTEKPYWLEEAYQSAIALADTGLVQRNLDTSAKLAALIYLCFDPGKAYVDAAGGYGLLTRLMRDSGFDFYWDDKYCDNLMARGFEAASRNLDVAAVTAFEVLEHLPDPLDFLATTMRRFGAGSVIVSTETYSGSAPPDASWWYYVFDTGQHIAFFRQDTLQIMAEKLGLHLFSVGGLHVFSSRPLRNRLLATMFRGRAAFPLARYIRRRLGSRIIKDHEDLLKIK